MSDWRERLHPLTRHFLGSMFDLGFLPPAAAESFKRLMLGTCGVLFAIGLLFARVLVVKYVALAGSDDGERYRLAVIGDHAFLMAVPMWIVALVTVLVGHALFPDETDFRVLTGLPISRRRIFRSKLLALGLFAWIFIAGAHVARRARGAARAPG